MSVSANITSLIACVVFTVGCENRVDVETCGDLRVRDNVITPYGLTITDCARAEQLARDVAQGREVLVYFDDCVLVGSGAAAWFACEERKRNETWPVGGEREPGEQLRWPQIVRPVGAPLRDGDLRILGHIWVQGPDPIDYQRVLLDGGAAVLSDAARSDAAHSNPAHSDAMPAIE